MVEAKSWPELLLSEPELHTSAHNLDLDVFLCQA